MADPIKKVTLSGGKVRFRFVIDIGRDADGKRKQLTVTRDTRKEAEAEYARIQHERNSGSYVAPNKITVSQWLDEWLERKLRDVEPTTIRSYKMALVHVHERIGHIRLQELTEDHVEEMVDWLLSSARRKGGTPGTGLRPSTVTGILVRLREALGRAVVRKLVATNVAEYVKVPKQARKQDRRDNRREAPWNVSEVQAFIRGIENDRLYAVLLLSLMGLRPAEVCGLRWIDIDLQLATLEIANTRTMIGNVRILEKDAKTEAGERLLPLPSKPLDALKKFKIRQVEERLYSGGGYNDSGYVAVDALGCPLNTRKLREHAYRVMEQLAQRKVRLYDARHSCLTYLAVSGVPDVVLAAWAGHTNASFTKARYVKPDVEALRTAASVWDGLHGDDSEAAL
ncbi:tyrosine-type recombinase/integrase [Streptomyces sp. PA03-6a]|nr:tyrosine-type recombinase/integrase [Streptomyces sp. PA03-6a]